MEEGNRFEEVDDAFLEEWAGEIKEERDCSFAKMYGPIRALFATDSVVLSKFEDCLDHMERLSFLLNMEGSWVFTSLQSFVVSQNFSMLYELVSGFLVNFLPSGTNKP